MYSAQIRSSRTFLQKQIPSSHYDEREWKVTKATIKGNTITLTIPDLQPTWGMSIELRLTDSSDNKFKRLIHNSIFELGE